MTNTHISRRTIVRGTAWATPAILATSAIPAYAASGCLDSYAVLTPGITTWTVPAGVTRLCSVEIMGGAGGSTAGKLGGSGSLVTADAIPVKAGQAITLYVGDGGINNVVMDGAAQNIGGSGFGKGGDALTPNSNGTKGLSGGSGGGGTAILIDSVPILVAGGGGGASNGSLMLPVMPTSQQKNGTPIYTHQYDGVVVNNSNRFTAHPAAQRKTGGDGGAGSQPGLDGLPFTETLQHAPVSFTDNGQGHGSIAGAGGLAGAAAGVWNGSFPSNFKLLDYAQTTGLQGEKLFGTNGSGAAGANGSQATIDYKYLAEDPHTHIVSLKAEVLGVAGAGGGGGYGGGGSGATSVYSIEAYDIATQSVDNYTFRSTAAMGSSGGGGGSYAATSVVNPRFAIGNNAALGYSQRHPGYIRFTYGK